MPENWGRPGMNIENSNHTVSQKNTDAETIQQVLSGDVNAFEILLRRYKRHVMGVVANHVPSVEVDDVAQDAFVRAYQSLAGYKGKSEFKYWLTGVAVRTCYDFWRKKYKRNEVPMSELSERHLKWLDALTAAQSSVEFKALQEKTEAQEMLAWALNRLSPADRMVLELVYLEGLSGKEAAVHLGWSTANVKVRSFRAKRKLKRIVSGIMTKSGNFK